MYIALEPYIKNMKMAAPTGVQPVARADYILPAMDPTLSSTDIDYVRSVDPEFQDEPGSLLDVYG